MGELGPRPWNWTPQGRQTTSCLHSSPGRVTSGRALEKEVHGSFALPLPATIRASRKVPQVLVRTRVAASEIITVFTFSPVPHTVPSHFLSYSCKPNQSSPSPCLLCPSHIVEEAGCGVRKPGVDTGTDIGFWGGPLCFLFLPQDIDQCPSDLWGRGVL